LIKKINVYADTVAEAANSSGYISTSLLVDTAFTQSNGSWVYFSAANNNINSVFYPISKDLRFYLTSVEPISEQKNLAQSIGGFVSSTQVCRGFMLYESVSIYDKTIVVDENALSTDYSVVDLQKNKFLQIDDEIVRVDKWSGLSAYLSDRNVYDTPLRMHSKGTVIRELIKNSFFDYNLGPNRKQYRCVAIKNINTENTAKDLRVYFNTNSRNNLSTIKIAIETPKSDYYSGAASTSGITSFAVYDLINTFEDDHYAQSAIVFTSGSNLNQTRIIKSYIKSSGTIILDQKLPYNISAGDSFYIDTAPATRNKSSVKAPVGENISQFYNPIDFDNSIPINVMGNRVSGNDLKPNEAIYVWLERSIASINDEYENNRFSLSLSYSRV
jgi:hypothetical protein